MRLKLFVVLVVALGFMALLLSCNKTTSPPTPQPQASPRTSNPPSAFAPRPPDGVDPAHAVDTSGKALPAESATQPDKPIILAKDIDDPKWGELKPEAAFDHTKHATDASHSLDGSTVTTCVECHHTEQPSAPAGREYLKKFARKEVLTAKQLEASKQPVKTCRACHFSPSAEETDEYPPASVTYPKEMNRPPSGKLTNDVAYHTRCISCHTAATTRDPKLKAPQACADCHTKK